MIGVLDTGSTPLAIAVVAKLLYLPCVHCFLSTERMIADIVERVRDSVSAALYCVTLLDSSVFVSLFCFVFLRNYTLYV